jgi:hypothetical protein
MAGKYGSSAVTVTYDDLPGGTGRAVTNHILEMGGIKITSDMEKSDAFGDIWDEHTPVGHTRLEPLTMSGIWDTSATTGPHVVFGAPDDDPADSTRTLVVVFGDGKTMTVETRLTAYEVTGRNGGLTRFTASILPTGAAVWT